MSVKIDRRRGAKGFRASTQKIADDVKTLRADGLTFKQIGERLGVSDSYAYALIKKDGEQEVARASFDDFKANIASLSNDALLELAMAATIELFQRTGRRDG